MVSALFSSESRPHLPPLHTGTIPRISNRRDKGGRKVLCKLAQHSIVVGGRNYPSGLRTTGARVDRISTRPGALSTVSTGFPVRSLGLLPLPQWGLSVWNHVPWVLLTSQLRFRRNVDQVSGVATSHNPFTQPLAGKKGSFLWDRKYLLRFVTAQPLIRRNLMPEVVSLHAVLRLPYDL